jgi:hypothetical protein
MKKTTKLRLLRVFEVFLRSFWNSIALSVALRMIIDSTNVKIEKPILFLLGCLFAMMFIEVLFIRFKEVLNDTFYDDLDKAEEIEREIEDLEKNNLK